METLFLSLARPGWHCGLDSGRGYTLAPWMGLGLRRERLWMVSSLWDHYLVFAFFFSPSVIPFRFPKTSVQSDVNCDLTTWS